MPQSYTNKIEKYFEAIKIGFRSEIIYPFNFLSEGILVIIKVAIMTALYTASYQALGVSEINSFGVADIVWISMIVESIRYSIFPIARPISDSIRDGAFAYQVSKPYYLPLYILSTTFGQGIPFFLTNFAVGILACYLIVGAVNFTLFGLICGLLLAFFGYLLDGVIFLIIGMSAMWIEDSGPLWWIYNKAKFILGGAIIPIAILPGGLREIAEFLPFSQVYYSAASMLVKFDFTTFLTYLGYQLIWITVFGLLALYLFRKGVRHVEANGG